MRACSAVQVLPAVLKLSAPANGSLEFMQLFARLEKFSSDMTLVMPSMVDRLVLPYTPADHRLKYPPTRVSASFAVPSTSLVSPELGLLTVSAFSHAVSPMPTTATTA